MHSSLSASYSRNQHRPHSVGSLDSSVSSTASSQTVVPPTSAMYGAGPPPPPPPPPRNQGPPGHLGSLHSVTRSPAISSLGAYGHSYGTSSTSPSTSSSVFQGDMAVDNGYPPASISPTHMSPGLSAQKRAYRQRRKDPSCDACRERKVKCDATETQSCSECATRSVKCQFTKETNRRMSSIKQVQDLQSQLHEARQEIARKTHLLSTIREAEGPGLKLPEITPSAERRVEVPVMSDFESVRQNIREHGKGIFKVPPIYRQLLPPQLMKASDQPLPRKDLVDKLLSHYYMSMHRLFPMLHWQNFQQQVEDLYERGSLEGTAQIWVSKFYAVLACGTLQIAESAPGDITARPAAEGVDFLRASTRTVTTWTDEMTMDHAQCCLLLSLFLTELNLKSAGWVWLGSAVRMAQDIGLHTDTGPWGVLEEEMRKRLWWCIYAQDRFLSLEGGRPPLINDEDCQVGWPCPVDDEFVHPSRIFKQPPNTQSHSSLPTVIPVIRFISQLKMTLKSRIIAPQTIRTYDDYFAAVMSTFPEDFQLQSSAYLEPYNLTVAFFLQAARFHLYRHNLSIACSPAERVDAINRCLVVARDTTRYISRTLQTQPQSPEYASHHEGLDTSAADLNISKTETWQASVKSTALNMACAHLWRCTLVLCFRADFPSALLCIRVSAAIGELRNMNMACGRHMVFFLETLLDRWRSGRGDQASLERDEEILAYLSGDLQGSTEGSWVWAGSETGLKLNSNGEKREPAVTVERPLTAAAAIGPRLNGENPIPDRSTDDPAHRFLPKHKPLEWGGWERVERLLHELMEEHQRPKEFPPAESRSPYSYHRPAHNEGKRLQLAPPEPSPGKTPTPPQPPQREPSASASRISIANII